MMISMNVEASENVDSLQSRRNFFVISLEKEKIFFLLFSIAFFAILMEPSYIANLGGWIHQLFRGGKTLFSIATIILFFSRRSKLKWPLMGIVLFEILLLLSTVLSHGNFLEQIRETAYIVTPILLMQILMETDPNILLETLSIVLGGYVNLNMICRLAYPEGMYRAYAGYDNCWLLGYDNLAVIFIFLAGTVSLYRIVTNRHQMIIWDWSVLISGIAFILIQQISSGILVLVACSMLLLLFKGQWFRRIFGKGKVICICMFVMFFLIQFFSAQDHSLVLDIMSLLNKNVSFAARTQLWKQAWTEIKSNRFLMGRGYFTVMDFVRHFGGRWITHLHCYYLQVLYEGGAVALGMLFILIFRSMTVFDKTDHKYSAMVLLTGIFAIMLVWQVEAYITIIRYFFVALFLLCNAGNFTQNVEKQTLPRVRLFFGRRR